jgi:hypothetical protein
MEFNPLHFTDQNGCPLTLGDTVRVTKGKNKSNIKWTFVFCIPQHRFGFIPEGYYESRVKANENNGYGWNRVPEAFVLDFPSLDFYWTPKSKMEIVKA